MKQVEFLERHLGAHERLPGDIPAWPGQALHEPRADGVANTYHDDRDVASHILRGAGGHRTGGNDDLYPQPNQLGRECAESFGLRRLIADLDRDIPAFRIAQFAQALTKRVDPGRRPWQASRS